MYLMLRERLIAADDVKVATKAVTKAAKKSGDEELECVSKRESCKFEWIFRHIKDESRRFSGAKSRLSDAEMAEKPPKLQLKEF